MCIYGSNNNDRVMVFVDFRNVTANSFDSPSGRFDYSLMIDRLLEGRRLVRAYVFDGECEDSDGCDRGRRIRDCLEYKGFTVRTRPYDSHGERQKGVDVDMACNVMYHAAAGNFDVAVLVTGDGDFVPLVEFLKIMGKRVEVASFECSLSKWLRRSADRIMILDGMGLFKPQETVQGMVCQKPQEARTGFYVTRRLPEVGVIPESCSWMSGL